jgi:thiamine biosynthesis protein ThiS
LQVNIHLHGILRDHLPPDAKGRAVVNLDDGATVGDLLTQLGIERRVIVALNGNQKPDKTHILQDGDQVSVFKVIGGG